MSENLVDTSEDETHCIAVSSRGILKSTDIHSDTPVSSIRELVGYDFNKHAPGNVVYVSTTALHQFWKILPNLLYPIVLVSGDCDISAPTDLFPSHIEFQEIINHPNLIHWFSQNCSYLHPKMTAIPIGMDYHTLSNNNEHPWGNQMTPVQQENLWKGIARSLPTILDRKLQCYANFHFAMTMRHSYQRHEAIAEVNPELVFYEPSPTTREAGWRKQGEYAFVLSPAGNGFDCHRTWEALCLGCIPIVFDTPINHVYHGLPVWIVKSWKEITKENMMRKTVEYMTIQYDWKRMRLDYWMNKIRSVSQSVQTTTKKTT
jgi:hypothetical protein